MKRVKLITLTMIALLALGCADEKKSSPATQPTDPVVVVPDGPYIPPGNGPGLGPGADWQYGATTEFEVVSREVFQDYTGRIMNDPQDVRINLNVLKYGDGYGGHVSIAYTDSDGPHEGYFTSGNTEKEVRFNLWFSKDGKEIWHGFFEDFYGGLIVVLDDVVDLGDGGEPTQASGSIWYKNFGLTPIDLHPPTRCWFVSLGPYDCRAWKTDRYVDTDRAIYPDSGYIKLGDFDNLDLHKAFNDSL